jgi:hemerythrin-like domain-containing protein
MIMLLVSAAFLILLVTEVARETPADGARRTEPIRQNLARLRKVLLTLERQFETIHDVSETRQIQLMHDAVGMLQEYLLPHLAAEEAVLFPAAERELAPSPASVTQALRREHEILRLWIDHLEALANGPLPDHNEFARRGERLLGLIEAHFDVEETVLFPVLDRAECLSRQQDPVRP